MPLREPTLEKHPATTSALTRRSFLNASALAGSAALVGLSNAKLFAATKSEAPETTAMTFGMIALTDCSPIIIAHEKGFFKKYGIDSAITKAGELGRDP